MNEIYLFFPLKIYGFQLWSLLKWACGYAPESIKKIVKFNNFFKKENNDILLIASQMKVYKVLL